MMTLVCCLDGSWY